MFNVHAGFVIELKKIRPLLLWFVW